LGDRWREVCKMYAQVNILFGDIVKVTPTSKVVGDMALFMVGNNLGPKDVLEGNRELSYPESVVEFFEGRLGEPYGGFPAELRKRVLRDRKPMEGRAGAILPPVDWEKPKSELAKILGHAPDNGEILSRVLYPKVHQEYLEHRLKYSDTSVLPTPVFFHGLTAGEETSIEIEKGKTLIVRFLTVGEPHADGMRTVFFELNGQPREVVIQDKALMGKGAVRTKANLSDPLQVAAPMPGLVSRVLVSQGDKVQAGQKLFTLEAMKMETTVCASNPGTVAEVALGAGAQVETGDLVVRLQ